MRSRSIIHVCAFILTLLPASAPALTAPESFALLVKAHKASVVNISTRQAHHQRRLADKERLLRGDVIIELDGKLILSPAELPEWSLSVTSARP
jgi:hypothetical protein